LGRASTGDRRGRGLLRQRNARRLCGDVGQLLPEHVQEIAMLAAEMLYLHRCPHQFIDLG
jgi:hypothetical protein